MTMSNSNLKSQVDYAEDLERNSTAKPPDVANLEHIELTEEDVRYFPAIMGPVLPLFTPLKRPSNVEYGS